MIKIYKYNDFINTFVIGDIHGHFDLLKDLIIMRDYLSNCILIVAGDSGFGFYPYDYYDKKMTELNMTLLENNIILYFIRGNHDDPSYFEENKIKFSNIETIPDYSVIQVGYENILCVGGGVSIDRKIRQAKDEIRKNDIEIFKLDLEFCPSYWEDEFPKYDEVKLNEIKEMGIDINYIVSHTSPSFCFKYGIKGIESWIEGDEELIKDLLYERNQMDLIYNHLKKDGHNVNKWVYGHFHAHNDDNIEGIRFITLNHIDYKEDIHFLNGF